MSAAFGPMASDVDVSDAYDLLLDEHREACDEPDCVCREDTDV